MPATINDQMVAPFLGVDITTRLWSTTKKTSITRLIHHTMETIYVFSAIDHVRAHCYFQVLGKSPPPPFSPTRHSCSSDSSIPDRLLLHPIHFEHRIDQRLARRSIASACFASAEVEFLRSGYEWDEARLREWSCGRGANLM